MKPSIENEHAVQSSQSLSDVEGWISDEIRLSSLCSGLKEGQYHTDLANLSIPLRVWSNRSNHKTEPTVKAVSHSLIN